MKKKVLSFMFALVLSLSSLQFNFADESVEKTAEQTTEQEAQADGKDAADASKESASTGEEQKADENALGRSDAVVKEIAQPIESLGGTALRNNQTTVDGDVVAPRKEDYQHLERVAMWLRLDLEGF